MTLCKAAVFFFMFAVITVQGLKRQNFDGTTFSSRQLIEEGENAMKYLPENERLSPAELKEVEQALRESGVGEGDIQKLVNDVLTNLPKGDLGKIVGDALDDAGDAVGDLGKDIRQGNIKKLISDLLRVNGGE